MNAVAATNISEAVRSVRRAMWLDVSSCDASDIEELVASINRELNTPHPNKATLALFLSSLIRGLRETSSAHKTSSQLETAMRDAGIEMSQTTM